MARTDAVTAVTGEVFREGWSKVRGSTQGLGSKQRQMVRAARGHRAAVFKAIRGGGTHTKAQLARQLEYLTTKSSHIIDSTGGLDGKATLTRQEIKDVANEFSKRWGEGFNPKLGHTTHMLLSYPVGTKGEHVRDITAAVAERFFRNEQGHFDYLIAVHEDRDHPHAHIVLNRRSEEGEIFYLGRDHRFNYDDFRLAMVEEADKVGVRLEATRRVDRGVLTYPARTGEVYAAKEEGRAPVERERVGEDLARAAAEIATASKTYGALSAEASVAGREDIADALFRAGEILARKGQLEQTGDIYMASFDEMKTELAERSERVEAMVRGLPEAERPAMEAEVNKLYADMAHLQPMGVRSPTLTQAPSDTGVYSQANINSELTDRLREPETRAQIETALRGTGISSETVIARVEQGANNAALEREWLAQDMEKIAQTDGLNLERREDVRIAADKLDAVHVKLGTALERAEVLRDDGVVDVEDRRDFHYDRQSVDDVSRAVRQEMRRDGAGEAQINERGFEIEARAEARIEQEQRDYLRERPEIIAAPSAVLTDEPFGRNVTDRTAFERVAQETDAIMARAGERESVEDAVARDFKDRYPDMPDHLARGLGRTYAQAEDVRNDEAVRRVASERTDSLTEADGRAGTDAPARLATVEEHRDLARSILAAERAEDARMQMREDYAGEKAEEDWRGGEADDRDSEDRRRTINDVVARERTDPIHASMPDAESKAAFRGAVEGELSDERLERLKEGDADALDGIIDDRLDRLYAAKAYLQSDATTAHSEALDEVTTEISEEVVEAQRLKHAHSEKGTTHG
ncbi:relaxase/mobilization nuclease domain-containing protein [Jannaschia rubra]|uniref:Type IV secretion system T-DNA border endonuclease VirD2 n=1 Tax=Jannaschia rubra TaxID=282197 RepID=A0A0M6XTG9_9RHOB|nr:relaxase/mobilization nuclease domain-containing protein [Jannaschia rubra]CTQ34456.1 type IV secretion system T-DNA border endonuclease VirD2 [Jannaschia rubra]